jgi:multiple sugar transport system substrate-binding protein
LSIDSTTPTPQSPTGRVRMTPKRLAILTSTAAVSASLLLSGCAGGEPAASGSSAPVADPASASGASGSINICGPKDASGVYKATAAAFTTANGKVTAKYTEIGANTDETRTQAVQRLTAKSSECDVFVTDVTWTAEFASQGWLYDHSKLVNIPGVIPSTVETTHYKDKYWGVPFVTNAGLIYYDKSKVTKPASWQQLYTEAAKAPGDAYVYQAKQYEGLTVNFLELLYSAGGQVIDDQGAVKIDSPETRKVLDLMANGIKSGAAEKGVLTYDEDGTRLAYESGNYGYERNWPNVYRLLNATKLAGTFGVAPLPTWDGGKASGVLGGSNLAISAFTKNAGASVAYLQFATSADWQKHAAADYLRAPVIEATYADPDVLTKMPFATELLASVKGAKPRPVSPVYAQISEAIYKNAYSVLSGSATSDQAAKKMAEDIKKAQESF